VKIGDPIIQIQDDGLWCEAWIDEKKFAGIDLDAGVDVTLKAYPNKKLKGHVSSFLPAPKDVQRLPQATEIQSYNQIQKSASRSICNQQTRWF
jgi:multidrug resistance efflux pump